MKNENILIILLLVILVFFLSWGFGFGMMPHMDYGQWGSYWTGGYGWMGSFMFLIGILVIAFLVLGIIWLAKQIKK